MENYDELPDITGVMNGLTERENMYREMYEDLTKEELVRFFATKDYFNSICGPEENESVLWCYVADETNTLYLANEQPSWHFTCPGKKVGDDVYKPEKFLFSDGEVNMRVPEAMRSMFPELKFGDEPVEVKLTISF